MSDTVLGAFRLEGSIGAGGMGQVHQARHSSGARVAVKLLTAERARETTARDRFRFEVQSVARLSHPNVVQVLDYGEVREPVADLRAGTPYCVLELAGGTLRENPPSTWNELRATLLAVLRGLACAHASGVVHRDVKPSNVLCFGGATDRVLKLSDFGIAHAIGGTAVQASSSGTPVYMAPEQFEGRWRDFGPWTDLYAVGCLAFELAAGSPPFTAMTTRGLAQAHRRVEPPPLTSRLPTPHGFEEWVRTLLSKDPAGRFEVAAEAAHALAALADAPGDGARSNPSPARSVATDWKSVLEFTTDESAGGGPVPVRPPEVSIPVPPTWSDPAPSVRNSALEGAGVGLYGWRSVRLVGRRRERDQIWSVLRRVSEERSTELFVLRGPAGVGKTRLAAWAAQHAAELGLATVLRATHAPLPGPATGIGHALAEHFACRGETRAEALVRIREHATMRGVVSPRVARVLARVLDDSLDTDAEHSHHGGLDDTSEEWRALLTYLHHQGDRRATLLVLDDLQWGSDSMAFLEYALAEKRGARLLVLATVQEEALAERSALASRLDELSRGGGTTQLTLGPLDEREHDELVGDLLGLDPRLGETVRHRTAGNPFFAVALVGDWVERELLEPGPRGFQLRADARADFPDRIDAIWAPKLDRVLGEATPLRRSFELAALLGLTVDDDEWTDVVRRAGIGPEGLDREPAVRHRLIVRQRSGFAFVHGMIRESLERSCRTREDYRRGHRIIADMLAERPASDRGGVAERLGRHLLAAECFEESVPPLVLGMRYRIDRGDYRAGLELVSLHADALRGSGVDESQPEWGDHWNGRAWIERRRGDLAAAEATAQAYYDEATQHGWTRRIPLALAELGDLALRRGDVAKGLLYLQSALNAQEGDDPDLVARCCYPLGWVMALRGDLALARQLFERALETAEAGHLYGLNQTHALWSLGYLRLVQGDLDGAREFTERARAEAERQLSRVGSAHAETNLAALALERRDIGEALTRARDAAAVFEQVAPAQAYRARAVVAEALVRSGQSQEAAELLESTIAELRAANRDGMAGLMSALHCLALASAGRFDDAETALRQASQAFDASGAVLHAAVRALDGVAGTNPPSSLGDDASALAEMMRGRLAS